MDLFVDDDVDDDVAPDVDMALPSVMDPDAAVVDNPEVIVMPPPKVEAPTHPKNLSIRYGYGPKLISKKTMKS